MTKENKAPCNFRSNLRANKAYTKEYINKRLAEFTKAYDDFHGDISLIEFGKQEIRGFFAITLYNKKGDQLNQIFFETTKELMQFIRGFMLGIKLNIREEIEQQYNNRKD